MNIFRTRGFSTVSLGGCKKSVTEFIELSDHATGKTRSVHSPAIADENKSQKTEQGGAQ